MKIEKIPSHILTNVVDFLVENNRAKSAEDAYKQIEEIDPKEIFNLHCHWQGLIGYGNSLWDDVHSLDGSVKS